jgi:hypothetical protein
MTITLSNSAMLAIEIYWLHKLGPFNIKIIHRQNGTIALPVPHLTHHQARLQHALRQPIITLQIASTQGGRELVLTAKLQPQLPIIDFHTSENLQLLNTPIYNERGRNFRELVKAWISVSSQRSEANEHKTPPNCDATSPSPSSTIMHTTDPMSLAGNLLITFQ